VKALVLYQRFFNYFFEKQKNVAESWQVQGHLLVTITTAPLMWSYALIALFYMEECKTPALIGVLASSFHILSPILLRLGMPIFFVMNVMIGSGIIHQATFSYHTGGFLSNILVWFGILPFLGGVISGRKGAIFWFFTTLIVSGSFLISHLNGFEFPSLLSDRGKLYSHILLVFGQIYLSGGLLWSFILLRDQNEDILNEKNGKIQNLLRIVCHDISNSLFIVENRLLKIIKDNPDDNLKKTYWAANNIKEVVRDVRDIVNFDKIRVLKFSNIPIREIIDHIEMLFEEMLYTKEIHLKIDKRLREEVLIRANEHNVRNQIFPNLISNCIKFSFPGSQISISLSELTERTVRITIKDEGIGIPNEIMKDIFEPTEKNSRIGTAGERGTGFGLPIVKKAFEEIGGTIFIESEATYPDRGHGTLYILEFNRA
jgi:signal transduction histidine kinase